MNPTAHKGRSCPLLLSPKRCYAPIDSLIENHAKENPELRKDLEELRAGIEEARRNARWLDVANIALRVVTLVKFLFDRLPPIRSIKRAHMKLTRISLGLAVRAGREAAGRAE